MIELSRAQKLEIVHRRRLQLAGQWYNESLTLSTIEGLPGEAAEAARRERRETLAALEAADAVLCREEASLLAAGNGSQVEAELAPRSPESVVREEHGDQPDG